jgi:hypothetical protein
LLKLFTNTGSQVVEFQSGGSKLFKTVPLLSSAWVSEAGRYKYVLSDQDIKDDSLVEVVPNSASLSDFNDAELEPAATVVAGSITMFAKNLPTNSISINYVII